MARLIADCGSVHGTAHLVLFSCPFGNEILLNWSRRQIYERHSLPRRSIDQTAFRRESYKPNVAVDIVALVALPPKHGVYCVGFVNVFVIKLLFP